MALTQGERSLHLTQIGKEVTHGTAVAATAVLNMESAGILNLDRQGSSPQEDYSSLVANQPGRGSYGVRAATLQQRGVVRFEDYLQFLFSGVEGGITPTGVGPYVWAFTRDATGDTLQSRTIEEGDNIQAYKMSYGLITQHKVSFSELTAPGHSEWQLEADWLGQDKVATTFTGSVASIVGAETAMGHLTQLMWGDTATAFASLTEQVGILAADITIPSGVVARKQGGTTDTFDTHGRQATKVNGNLTLYQTAGTKTALFDVFTAAGSVMTEKRARIKVSGSGTKVITWDMRLRLHAVPVAESNGATIYRAEFESVYDSTLASDLVVTVTNSVATQA